MRRIRRICRKEQTMQTAPRSPIARPDERRRDLAKIHMAVQALGWDDGTYRDVLFTVTGCKSSAMLDITGRQRFLAHLQACGWRPTGGGKADPLLGKLRALWIGLHACGAVTDRSDRALDAWVHRESGVRSARWLKPGQARLLIERLKQWSGRVAQQQQQSEASHAG